MARNRWGIIFEIRYYRITISSGHKYLQDIKVYLSLIIIGYGNAHEPWSLGVKRSGSDTTGFSIALATPFSIPKKILS